MYENATILDYKGKKIWIKHIEKQLYCVNGRYIAFNPKQDISKSVIVAIALDNFYCPWFGDIKSTGIILHHTISSQDNKFRIGLGDLANGGFDTSIAHDVLDEYFVWKKSMPNDEIYIDDCRNMDMGDWIIRQDVKVKGDVI